MFAVTTTRAGRTWSQPDRQGTGGAPTSCCSTFTSIDWGTRLATQAEAKLASLAYGNRLHEAPPSLGPRVHFRSFDQYVVAHKKHHHVLDTLERWGYPTGVLLSQRKHYFLDGMFVDPYERIEVMASHRDVVNLDFDALLDKCRVVVVEDTEESQTAMVAAPSYSGATAIEIYGTNPNKMRRTYY
jgi:hypothetical protein